MRSTASLLIHGLTVQESIDVYLFMPCSPTILENNQTVLSLPVGKCEETEWSICKIKYCGHPRDPDATSVHIYTKPLKLPEDEARDLVDEITEKFGLLIPSE